jgi:hypothetical protein
MQASFGDQPTPSDGHMHCTLIHNAGSPGVYAFDLSEAWISCP